ncbi:hypothetical protein FIM08_01540 [SAR202 cluster bacterium AC-647-N09_OGT_505m]|nr:hypothetical protein [SAR202 cluster bacterium AC-647-N09_OGT_505m]
MFWSQIVIPNRPRVLVVDYSCNWEGWEVAFCDRIFNVLSRKGVGLVGRTPLRAQRPQDLSEVLDQQDSFNCIFMLGHGDSHELPEEIKLRSFWEWLSNAKGLTPKLLAVCTCRTYDSHTSAEILTARGNFAGLALVPQSPLVPREAGLFFMKFFAELDLHAEDDITGKMVWFSHSKAREILKRRHYLGKIGVRC